MQLQRCLITIQAKLNIKFWIILIFLIDSFLNAKFFSTNGFVSKHLHTYIYFLLSTL